MSEEYKYWELTSKIIETAMEVHRILGPGYQEIIYHNALCLALRDKGILFAREKEIEILSKIMENPEKPLGLIIAGTKAEDKVKVIEKFLDITDFFLLGNLTAEEVRKRKIKDDSGKIIFPKDSLGGLDIGPLAREVFREKILSAKTIFWAGPLGKIDQEKYQAGTREVIKAILDSKCFSVAGGGDTIEFINKLGVADKFGHISVGGSAMLAFLAGEKLPGLEVLQ